MPKKKFCDFFLKIQCICDILLKTKRFKNFLQRFYDFLKNNDIFQFPYVLIQIVKDPCLPPNFEAEGNDVRTIKNR